jgi:hypothetical protein
MAGWTGLAALFAVAALMPWPLLLGPDNWWAFVLVSAAIVAVLRLLVGQQWTACAGIKLPPAHVLIVVVAFVLVATGSRMLLSVVYEAAGLKAAAPGIAQQFGFLFQAFNEEILWRALLIGLVVQYVRPAPLISFGLAFLFSSAHFLLYRYSNPMHLALSITALATLFMAGVAMNNLYLAFRHIGFSWALHAGWNVVWLPAPIYEAATNERLREPQIFDRVMGSPAVFAMACVMAALSLVLLVRGPRTSAGRDCAPTSGGAR